MKDSESQNDRQLSRLLGEWNVAAPLPPRFEEQVWQRISRAEAEAKPPFWRFLLDWLETTLPRRAVATAYLMVLLLAGLAAGYWESRHQAAEVDDALSRQYVQMVDPFQAHRTQ
jgi:hypothetical protein